MKPFSGILKSPLVAINKKKKELEIQLSEKVKQGPKLLTE